MAGDPRLVIDMPGDADWQADEMKLPTARGVLSAAEIEMLLRPDLPDAKNDEDDTVIARDLDAFTDTALEKDAALLASQLTLAARRDCHVDALFKARTAFTSEFNASPGVLGADPVLVVLEQGGAGITALFGLSQSVAAALIDRIYGGGTAMGLSSVEQPRKFSALDRLVLERVLAPLAACIDPSLTVSCVETDAAAAIALIPPGTAMVAELSCQIGGVQGDAVFSKLDHLSRDSGEPAAFLAKGALQTTLIARIASLQVPVSRLSNLKAGSTLLLGLPTTQPVELLSGSRSGPLAAEGEVGRKGDKIAVRLTRPYRITG